MDTFDDNGKPVDKKGKSAELKYRKRGPEKNHRPDSIVEMGLLMDRNGIPLAFDLFPGNNKADYNPRDGYVYGQSVRGADAEFKAWVLGGGYKTEKLKDDDGNEVTFIHKSRIHPKTIQVNVTIPGQKKKKKKSVSFDQKQMAYYSEKYAKKQKRNREIMIARAKDLISHPKKYGRVTAAGSGLWRVCTEHCI